jgi:hypothetical protein
MKKSLQTDECKMEFWSAIFLAPFLGARKAANNAGTAGIWLTLNR